MRVHKPYLIRESTAALTVFCSSGDLSNSFGTGAFSSDETKLIKSEFLLYTHWKKTLVFSYLPKLFFTFQLLPITNLDSGQICKLSVTKVYELKNPENKKENTTSKCKLSRQFNIIC